MRVEHDPRADAAYISLVDEIRPGEVARTVLCDPQFGMINLDFDSSGHLLGIEVVGASKHLSAEVLQRATKIGK